MADKDMTIIADSLLSFLSDNDIDEFEDTMEKKVDILSIWLFSPIYIKHTSWS